MNIVIENLTLFAFNVQCFIKLILDDNLSY